MDISSPIIQEQKKINETTPLETKGKEEISNVQEERKPEDLNQINKENEIINEENINNNY